MNLEKYEYIWQVNYVSKDDGHNLTDSYWTDIDKAEKRAKEIGGRAGQTTLFCSSGRWYKVEYKEVNVDIPSKEEVLKKLSINERKALGIENF